MSTLRTARFMIAVSAFVASWPAIAPQVHADLANELENLIGYTIVAAKTIEDEFEGCDYGRAVRFTDGTSLECSDYGYQYAYRPTAVILAKRFQYEGKDLILLKMAVEDEVYDMKSVESR